MKKKGKIIIIALILLILVIVGIILVVRRNNTMKEEQERINRTIETGIQEEETEEIKEKLERAGLKVEGGDLIYSEVLNRNGKSYKVNGTVLEIYVKNDIAMTIEEEKNSEVTTIEGKNGEKVNALLVGNVIILNCHNEQMQKDIIEALTNEM